MNSVTLQQNTHVRVVTHQLTMIIATNKLVKMYPHPFFFKIHVLIKKIKLNSWFVNNFNVCVCVH